ncbi:MAG: sialate O-acetylesterase [Clostridia bacterium]|nr:sialate O-acetylesterase [Clostridia bacterium]
MILNQLFVNGAVLQAGKPIKIFGEGSGTASVEFLGSVASVTSDGAKWLVELPAAPYGGPYEMKVTMNGEETVLSDVWLGDVYIISGQSNMQFKLRESDYPKESYTDEPMLRLFSTQTYGGEIFTPENGWVPAEAASCGSWSCLGYLSGKFMNEKKPGVMTGLITCYIGASAIQAFLPDRVFDADPSLVIPECMRYDMGYKWNTGHSQIYHYIWKKIVPYSVKAIVFYQGESNYSEAEALKYRILLGALIREWRADMSDSALPFVIVQIADYYHRTAWPWKMIQDAQADAGKSIKGVKTVVCRDVCDDKNIHPKNKTELAHRIADALSD